MKRIYSILFAWVIGLSAWAQSGVDYDPANPAAYYTLTAQIQVALCNGEIAIEANESIEVKAGESISFDVPEDIIITDSDNQETGYTFKQWMIGDSLVSTSLKLDYTMPAENVVLTAYYEYMGYDPTNPDDEFEDGYTHEVSVYAMPSTGGYFNSSYFRMKENEKTTIYAYPHKGYRFSSWKQDGKIISTENPLRITMGTEDLEYTATFVYDPISPGDPNMPPVYYTLTMQATPRYGGSVNNSNSQKVEAGESVYCYAYDKTGYTFKQWMVGDSLVSTSRSFYYTMPAENVVLTAYFEYMGYDPTNPDDPFADGYIHDVSVYAMPSAGGYFNSNYFQMKENEKTTIYAYPHKGYRFSSWKQDGKIISTENPLRITMGTEDLEYTATFVYDPISPSDPDCNYFNAETGELIVDRFTTGKLNNTIYNKISGNYQSVTSILVAGPMNSSDFGFSYNFDNCLLIDLARTTGYTQVPTWSFESLSALAKVILPSTVEEIGQYAFYGCNNLTELVCYAAEPPVVYSYTFVESVSGLVVRVPSFALPLYQEAEVWKDFTILPLDEEVCALNVNLPTDAADGRYKNMTLELHNLTSGQISRYLITDRVSYTFANIVCDTKYNISVKNKVGAILGTISDVAVEDEDVAVAFESLLQPQNITTMIVAPENVDVTSQATIKWFDEEGKYLSQGAVLKGILEGSKISYSVTLSKDLAMMYVAPQDAEYEVKSSGNEVVLNLQPYEETALVGTVKDATTGQAISGANITVSQLLGNKYTKSVVAKADNKGNFSTTIYNMECKVVVGADGYISQTFEITSDNTRALKDVRLKPITGATITTSFTYRTSVEEGATPDIQNWYSDYANVAYSIYNKTQQKVIHDFNVQYPSIVLLEEVAEGDELQFTATSKNGAFVPVEATAVIDASNRAEAIFDIVALGGIRASFTSTDNSAVVGILYDAKGQLIKKYNYSSASITINDLQDGNYTLVSMGSSTLFNSIYNLSQLPSTGLKEGSDFVVNTIAVESGLIATINNNLIPKLDESKLYYTGSNTMFSVNKTSVTAGNYLTLKGKIDFKDVYASKVSNVSMVIDLPESAEFVENSVMVGTNISSYTLDGNRLTIPLERYTDQVRFCIIPTAGGDYAPNAFAQFIIDDKEVLQPIGSAHYTIKDLSINVPSTVAKTTIPVSGTALGNSTIQIYDNDVLIGETTSLANGVWNTTCELDEPYNLSTHSIYAKVTNKQGLKLQSETRGCMYDMNAIQVNKVTMYYNGYVNEFDFQNPSSKSQSYTYSSNTAFTFTIDFNNNDTTKVSNVILYVKTMENTWVPLSTMYDRKKELWVASTTHTELNSYPVNVSVDFNSNVVSELDLTILNDYMSDIQTEILYQDSINSIVENEFETLKEIVNSGVCSVEKFDSLLNNLYSVYYKIDVDYIDPIDKVFFERIKDLDESERNKEIAKEQEKRNRKPAPEFEKLWMGLNEPINENAESSNGTNVRIITESPIYNAKTGAIDIIDEDWDVSFPESSEIVLSDSESNGQITVDLSNSLPYPEDSDEAYRQWGEQAERLASEYISQMTSLGAIGTTIAKELAEQEIQRCLRELSFDRQLLRLQLSYEPDNRFINPEYYRGHLENIENSKSQLSKANSTKATVSRLSKGVGGVGAFMGGWSIGSDIRNGLNINEDWNRLIDKIEKCKDSNAPQLAEEAKGYKDWIRRRYVGKGFTDLASTGIGIAGTAASGVTFGVSLLANVGGAAMSLAATHWEHEFTKTNNKNRSDIIGKYKKLDCEEEEEDNNPNGEQPQTPDLTPVIDPSGYVYEGVSSNRVEGVMASCYYKETVEDMYGDLHENVVLWDAEQYAQENPLFTDEYGMYRWDVPQGLWQVKFEKEGYETAYSDWLPVPPPQLEVNVPIVQNRQPEVVNVHAYTEGIEMEFDKYMQPATLNTDNIFVVQNGETVAGTVTLLNEEVTYEGKSETYASKVRFVFDQPVTAEEITLTISNRVKNYAGVQMQDSYTQTFDIEQEIMGIVADSMVTVSYGGNRALTVKIEPAEAAAGKTLLVNSLSPMILTVDIDSIKLDSNGEAVVMVTGELPGSGVISYELVGYDHKASTIVKVEYDNTEVTANPTASIASGTTVAKGTDVTLYCSTDGAVIYYTLDGSCPCDENTQIRYDGTPIVINNNTELRMMAVAEGRYESDVVVYYYYVAEVEKPVGVIIHQKWNDVLICDNSAGGFVAYQWYKNDRPIDGETNQYYAEEGGLNGSYYVMAQYVDGNWAWSNTIVCVGREESGLKVTPTIVKRNEKCVVSINRSETCEEVVYLNVFNAVGQKVKDIVMDGNSVELEFDNSGPYFIKATGLKDNMESVKIIVTE